MKIQRVTCCLFVLLLSLIVFAFVPRSQASAASGRVTKGDVESNLQIVPNAGGILFHARPVPGFAFQTRSILSPSALSVCDHTAGLVATDPVFGTFTDSSTFTVDASGTGVCLQPLS